MFRKIIIGQIRHFLTTIGGGFVGQGIITSDDLTLIVGGIVTLIGAAWSALEKQKEDKPKKTPVYND